MLCIHLLSFPVPSYDSVHKVQAEPWSYPEDLVSELVGTSGTKVSENERLVDLAHEPPEYVANEEYLSRIKEDLGIATVGFFLLYP